MVNQRPLVYYINTKYQNDQIIKYVHIGDVALFGASTVREKNKNRTRHQNWKRSEINEIKFD